MQHKRLREEEGSATDPAHRLQRRNSQGGQGEYKHNDDRDMDRERLHKYRRDERHYDHRGQADEKRSRNMRSPPAHRRNNRRLSPCSSYTPSHNRDHQRQHFDTRHGHDRSRSPVYRERQHRDKHHSRQPNRSSPSQQSQPIQRPLPYDARLLLRSTADLELFEPLLAKYLEVQKQKDLATMDEREIRGRWKAFVGKWNMGELAEGWYSAEIFEESASSYAQRHKNGRKDYTGSSEGQGLRSSTEERKERRDDVREDAEASETSDDEDDDNDYGPMLPQAQPFASRRGPDAPTFQDLSLRREDHEVERLSLTAQQRLERRAERATEKERLEELAPRAEAGTRERQLEKKREVAAQMRSFRERRSPDAPEMGSGDMFGGDEGGGIGEYKRIKAEAERKKSEREIRREEILRAKAVEREERVQEYRRREEDTLRGLKEIARMRFG